MKKMTLKEIQSVNLETMKDIHSFCVNNDIHYSLAYGSLIGAIRHKGFIPWDDDIDIMMPRPDFERFSEEFKSGNGNKLISVYDNDTFFNYSVVSNEQTFVKRLVPAAKFDTGVWIDVYPIDAIPDDEEQRRMQFKKLRYYTQLVATYRYSLGIFNKNNLQEIVKTALRAIRINLFTKGDFNLWHQTISDICKEYSFGSTTRCSSLVCVEANTKNKQEIFDTDDFANYILTTFEDTQFYIAAGYDHILKNIFGDYMQLPPKEKQVYHHNVDFYWK